MKISNDQTNTQKGFTLLEILITISVMATIATLITQVFFTTTHTNTKTEILKEVKQNGDFALDIMTRMVRNARSVESTCASTGTNLDALDIKNPDVDSTEFGCYYDAVNGVARIASTSATSGSIQYLTSSNVTLGASCANSLKFTCASSSYEADKITITFQLAQRGTPVSQFEKAQTQFQITVSSRN